LFETSIKIIEKNRVLFLDEFQVTDIADAMILKRLFEILWSHGVVLIISSNREPEHLYYNGIQRDSFLPFIDTLKDNMNIV
jgi:predicted ATPase